MLLHFVLYIPACLRACVPACLRACVGSVGSVAAWFAWLRMGCECVPVWLRVCVVACVAVCLCPCVPVCLCTRVPVYLCLCELCGLCGYVAAWLRGCVAT